MNSSAIPREGAVLLTFKVDRSSPIVVGTRIRSGWSTMEKFSMVLTLGPIPVISLRPAPSLFVRPSNLWGVSPRGNGEPHSCLGLIHPSQVLSTHTPRTQVLIDLVANETKQGVGGAGTADPRISCHCPKPLRGGSAIAGPLGNFTGTSARLKDL